MKKILNLRILSKKLNYSLQSKFFNVNPLIFKSFVKNTNNPNSPNPNTNNLTDIKVLKITDEEQQTIEEFAQGITNDTPEQIDSKEKKHTFPLIHYSYPIVPFSKITISNPSKNDILFNILIKYGKLNPIDEETTIIEDVTLFFDKEDIFTPSKSSSNSKKENFNNLNSNFPIILGVLCKVTYLNKEKLIIEAQDRIYKVKALRSGKLKFFNPKETPIIETLTIENEEYINECVKLLKNLANSHEYITEMLGLNEEYFNDNNKINFSYTFSEIKNILVNSIDNSNLTQLIEFSYYFLLKANTFSNIIHNTSSSSSQTQANDIFKTLNISDLKTKLEKILHAFDNVQKFINIKYDFYKFPHPSDLNFEFETPFGITSVLEQKRMNKYKDVIDNKISEVDTIEKQKDEYKRKVADIKSLSEEVKKSIEKEINKISSVHLEQENGKRIEYINHILQLPFDKYDDQVWDIDYAKEVLDSELYGLNETKERIYEFIAKNMKNNNKKGCVILLTGGPGTGKTRIAKLIGKALKRKVGFVSLAGVSDGKSILGFKRTYVSSTPGMFIREMQNVGVNNPVIVVDEIDKVGFRYSHSNVYHSLLQLLNHEENHRFQDHYLEIPYDFSNVVFILTSNNDEIFPPLIDRMEVIKVDPYVNFEKFLIVKNYAKDQILKEYNLNSNFQITDMAIYKLIFQYCKREAGVRKAKKLLESVVRKVNSKIELDKNIPESDLSQVNLQINSNNILRILNEPTDDDPVLTDMIMNGSKNIGCCIGLFVSKTDQSNSWGSASIFSLSVKEIIKINDRDNKNEEVLKTEKIIKKSKITSKKEKKEKKTQFKISSSGNLGEDSLQSVDIALNYATELLNEISPNNADFFYKHQIHHDCPEILLPKSGPSAGTVIFLCAMSLALNKPIIPNLAMTGEICIDGSVLKIGGVKEKAQGAQTFGVRTLVIPIGNKYDFLDLPENLKNSFERVFFVNNCKQIYNIGFNLNTYEIDCYRPDICIKDIHDLIEEEVFLQNNITDQLFK